MEEEKEMRFPENSFKEWIEQLCLWCSEYNFLLDGYQTGEIFDIHEYYIEGKTPREAMISEYNEYG